MKLSKKKLIIGGLVIYVIGYNAGRKDTIKQAVREVKQLEALNQSIGYMKALNDVTKGMVDRAKW